MIETFSVVIALFFAYSFIGWLWETIFCSISEHHFVYRGFLLGPITPIYGFGILGVLYLVSPYQKHLFLLFFISAILVTILEYLTSYCLEKFFHLTLWDYHHVPLNINGRIAIPVSIFWGICCVIVVKYIQPLLLDNALHLYHKFSIFLPIIAIALTSCDLGYTLANLASFTKTIHIINEKLTAKKVQLGQELADLKSSSENLLQTFFHENQRDLPQLSFQDKRFLQAFPNMKFKNLHPNNTTQEMHHILKKMKAKNE
ncbi:MAG TPA: putative ABC transporter permease [Enterococcus columbae]|nr:putative ABC transporter permease [Enterococcus columbae]